MSGSAASAVMSACETTYATHRPSGASCGSDTAFRAITSSKVMRLGDCARAGSTAKKSIAAMAKRETERRGRIGEDRGSKMEDGRPRTEDRRPRAEDRRPKTEDRRPRTSAGKLTRVEAPPRT